VAPAQAGGGKLAEGVLSAPAILRLAQARGVEMPIVATVAAVLEGAITARESVELLLSRPRTREK
jgi:glycerol-3-phosphate dehydrogenase (NAD(P)+)